MNSSNNAISPFLLPVNIINSMNCDLFPLHPSVLDLALKSVESLMFFLAFSLEIRFAALFLGGGLFLGSALTLFAFAGLPPLFHCAPHSFASLFPGNLS